MNKESRQSYWLIVVLCLSGLMLLFFFNGVVKIINRAEVKAIIRRFEEREGIRGVIICDSSGLPIDSNMEINISEEIAAYVTSLIGKGRQVVDALNEGDLSFIRLETSVGGESRETMIALEENLILIILK